MLPLMTMDRRPRVGFVSASSVTLPWEGERYLAEGVGAVVTGMNVLAHDGAEFARAGAEFGRAVRAVAREGVGGVLVNAVPLAALWGWAKERRVLRELAGELGVPVVSASSAVVETARARGLGRLALVSAYRPATNEAVTTYLAAAGLEPVAATGLGASGPSASNLLTPAAFADAARVLCASTPGPVDAIVLGSRGSVADSLGEVEAATGLPVLHGLPCGLRLIQGPVVNGVPDAHEKEPRRAR